VDGKLIVNPGAKEASLVALDPMTGKVLWKTPGNPASYGSLIQAKFGNNSQIVGYDLDSLGGWDAASGKRLWKLTPDVGGDFNVPTPIQIGQTLLVSTENNGTRVYSFNDKGEIEPKPIAAYKHLSHDSHTPVVVGDRVFGVKRGLHCLDHTEKLKLLWEGEDKGFADYCSIIASETRVLIVTMRSELILVDAAADKFRVLNRVTIFDNEKGLYSHPAIVGSKMYIRSGTTIACIDLEKAQ
jgi:outer membrane protein assembly factor BamB